MTSIILHIFSSSFFLLPFRGSPISAVSQGSRTGPSEITFVPLTARTDSRSSRRVASKNAHSRLLLTSSANSVSSFFKSHLLIFFPLASQGKSAACPALAPFLLSSSASCVRIDLPLPPFSPFLRPALLLHQPPPSSTHHPTSPPTFTSLLYHSKRKCSPDPSSPELLSPPRAPQPSESSNSRLLDLNGSLLLQEVESPSRLRLRTSHLSTNLSL